MLIPKGVDTPTPVLNSTSGDIQMADSAVRSRAHEQFDSLPAFLRRYYQQVDRPGIRPAVAEYLLSTFLDALKEKSSKEAYGAAEIVYGKLMPLSENLIDLQGRLGSLRGSEPVLWDKPLTEDEARLVDETVTQTGDILSQLDPKELNYALTVISRVNQLINLVQSQERLARVTPDGKLLTEYEKAKASGISLQDIDSREEVYTLTAHPNKAVTDLIQETLNGIGSRLAQCVSQDIAAWTTTEDPRALVSDEVHSEIRELLSNLAAHPLVPEVQTSRKDEARTGHSIAKSMIEGDKLYFQQHWEARKNVFGAEAAPPESASTKTSWIERDSDGRDLLAEDMKKDIAICRRIIVDEYQKILTDARTYAGFPEIGGALFGSRIDTILDKLQDARDFWNGTPYSSAEFAGDIQALIEAVPTVDKVAHAELLDRLYLVRYLAGGRTGDRGYGMNLLRGELRDNSELFEKALNEIFELIADKKEISDIKGAQKYLDLDDETRGKLLAILDSSEDVRAAFNSKYKKGSGLEVTDRILDIFTVCREALERDPKSFHHIIVSLTAAHTDLLECLTLTRLAGINRDNSITLPITMLSERPEDLQTSAATAEQAMKHPEFSRAIGWWGRFIGMFGFSDSAMRGGFASRVMARDAESEQKRVGDELGIRTVSKKGIGPKPGRGGGRFANAIFRSQASLETKYNDVTVQGEGAPDNFGNPVLACRSFNSAFENFVEGLSRLKSSGVQTGQWESRYLQAFERGAIKFDRVLHRYALSPRPAEDVTTPDDMIDAWQLLIPLEDLAQHKTASRSLFRFTIGDSPVFEKFRAVPNNMLSDISRLGWMSLYGVGEAYAFLTEPEQLKETRETLLVNADFKADTEAVLLSLQRNNIPLVAEMVRATYAPYRDSERVQLLFSFINSLEEDYLKLTQSLELLLAEQPQRDALKLGTFHAIRQTRNLKDPITTNLQLIQFQMNGARYGVSPASTNKRFSSPDWSAVGGALVPSVAIAVDSSG